MYRPPEKVIHEFITESNAIERYTAETVLERLGVKIEDTPYWRGHVAAVELALDTVLNTRTLPDIRGVHYVLMHDIPDVDHGIDHHEVGDWRRSDVVIGGEKTPKPFMIPRLIEAWEKAAKSAIETAAVLPAHQRVDMCYQFHHWFECIHPFVDGNGRTGRIMWNAMRMLCGLDWTVVRAAEKQAYYDDISRWRHSRWDSLRYHSLQQEDDQIRIHVGDSDGV